MTTPLVQDLDADGALSRRHPVPPDRFTYEPSERHVRGLIGEVAVVDSYAPLLLWEPGRAVPTYVFPRADVRTDLLRPDTARVHGKHHSVRQWYDLELDGVRHRGLVLEFDVDGLGDVLAFEWFGRSEAGVEHWYEEDEEVFVHPRDIYKRVDPLPSSRHVEIFLDGVKLADTTSPVLLFETRLPIRYYIPAADIDFSHLTTSTKRSRCPYKGVADYWSVTTGRGTYDDLVWSYADPIPAARTIAGRLAFYNELVDIVVDGVPLERPTSEFTAALATAAVPRPAAAAS